MHSNGCLRAVRACHLRLASGGCGRVLLHDHWLPRMCLGSLLAGPSTNLSDQCARNFLKLHQKTKPGSISLWVPDATSFSPCRTAASPLAADFVRGPQPQAALLKAKLVRRAATNPMPESEEWSASGKRHMALKWVWVKLNHGTAGFGVHVSTYQGSIWGPIFDPQPFGERDDFE